MEDRRIAKVTCHELPLDWENEFSNDERTNIFFDKLEDAYIYCLNSLGRVDIEFISATTKLSCSEVIRGLGGAIYQNPDKWNECFYKGWESCDEYLSGNLITKWNKAKEANEKYNGYFKRNVDALAKIIPDSVKPRDIYITLGSPFVPPDMIDDFIYYLMGGCKPTSPHYATHHDEKSGIWEIPDKTRFRYGKNSVKSTVVYGTSDMEMLYLLENTLNMKAIAIYDQVISKTNKSGVTRIINQEKTLLALEKQKLLIERFQNWVWSDKKRVERLQMIYDSQFGCIRTRSYDGSYLTFPNMNPSVKLHKHQRDAVARILQSDNTLLAHDVGAGKTYVMIASGMELRRMGISKKNMFVIPNNLMGQWKSIFTEMYPNAKLLCIEPKDFTPVKRNNVLYKIKHQDYDAIIMVYSCFDMIPLSYEYYENLYDEVIKQITKARSAFSSQASVNLKKKSIQKTLEKLKADIMGSDLAITFDELGINSLFVDEAHNYKNVTIETQISNVLGISTTGSKKCNSMLHKVECVQKNNGGRGVIFATGTPITNSITDAFIMQRYLQSGQLALMGLDSFDGWVGMFAEKQQSFEVDVDTGRFRLATRFSKFHNLPELTSILSSIADFYTIDKSKVLPDFKGYKDSIITNTDEFKEYLAKISHRADMVRSKLVSRKEDNMLKITTDGRKAALDLRLVEPTSAFTYQSKVARCAELVADLYHKTSKDKSAQLIFCDTSTPKKCFNVYDELSRLLVSMGVRADEIAYAHDATTDKKRDQLFKDVRNGKIRVLIGSTFKLGMGVNVQERLIAIHHIDVPWRPADMIQREGRILRQGNTNDEVYIFRYITEGSFDAYSWQLLESKSRFICALLSGSLKSRSATDIDSSVLNYAEVKALAIGNPLIKERVEVSNELERYYILHKEEVLSKDRALSELGTIPARIERARLLISQCKADIDDYNEKKVSYSKEEAKEIRQKIDSALKANVLNSEETEVLTYQGFKVIVPAYMSEEKPCVYLVGQGKYLIEMGTELGVTRRLDFFLEEFDRQLAKYKNGLEILLTRQIDLQAEINKKNKYTDKIEALQERLNKIDEELGVNCA
ncbi:MAG: DEAD/DEAH box helicase family protein [Clostridia bacterium]|nr:DEAD/DEAH box helicase family protein [Clostridia bacterium]